MHRDPGFDRFFVYLNLFEEMRERQEWGLDGVLISSNMIIWRLNWTVWLRFIQILGIVGKSGKGLDENIPRHSTQQL